MSARRIIGAAGFGLLSLVALTATGPTALSATAAEANDAAVVDMKGMLRVPADYRATYEYLGTWAVAADAAEGSKGLHVVYASPGTTAAYRKDGHFPDGTILVKEVFEAVTGQMTTGTVSHAQTLKGWFVMVRDSKDSYPGNPLWGDGWGWSWFDTGDPVTTTSTNYESDCKSCHVPASNSDWIYVEGYPLLQQ